MNTTQTTVHIAEMIKAAYTHDLNGAHGFLPKVVPGGNLPSIFDPYLAAAAEVPARLVPEGRGARAWLERQFSHLDPEVLSAAEELSLPEQYELMLVFCVLAHAYRWNTMPATPDEYARKWLTLPIGIELPRRQLAQQIGQPCTTTLWNSNLTNWRLKTKLSGSAYHPDELTLDDLSLTYNWLLPPYAEDAERFMLTFVLVEARGAAAIKDVVYAIEAAAYGNEAQACYWLGQLQQHIQAMGEAFARCIRRSVVNMSIWPSHVQPFFAWGVETKNDAAYGGPSGMNLGCFQTLDIGLDIPGKSDLACSGQDYRVYMQPWQRRFLAVLETGRPILRQFVETSDNQALKDHYNACLTGLQRWRVSHSKRGALYMRGSYESGETLPQYSTGMTVEAGEDRVEVFTRQMGARIQETISARVAV